MKSSRKLLALILILAMMTCSFAMRGMAMDQVEEAMKAKNKVASFGGTTIDNHHSIPRDQYNNHGGGTGEDDGSGSGSGGIN
ncbi:hypothetical protein LUZ63_001631 [Rhynchospora breviuscula]|uniref:Uncharacterized protein n=1 Tax=Rhynchospora breviuscula TaxID=2022672 RepID=A0A9Q0CX91_9POAL|nr:hypothetical protein LUZ63_001631 [Rhynchospora breviuscula]